MVLFRVRDSVAMHSSQRGECMIDRQNGTLWPITDHTHHGHCRVHLREAHSFSGLSFSKEEAASC